MMAMLHASYFIFEDLMFGMRVQVLQGLKEQEAEAASSSDYVLKLRALSTKADLALDQGLSARVRVLGDTHLISHVS